MMKQTIILLHGALGSKEQLDPLKASLSGRFEVFSLDFEGHGTKASGGNYSMEAFSKNLLDFMAEQQLEKTNLFGYSMGGYVALTFAAVHPEKVGKIVTLGTKFNWTPESAAAETKKLDPDKIEAKVPAFAASLASLHGTVYWKKTVAETAAMMTALGNGKAIKRDAFSEIHANTLLLLAEHDSMVTLSETELVQISLPNAELQIVPDAKHPLETTDPEKLAALIAGFILE